jgi:DTW domain-containing protein YfiP
MTRRGNSEFRCARCRLHASLCVCSVIPRLETRTRVVLVIHRFEDRKPTNTGRLATECLTNSQVIVRGEADAAEAPLVVPPDSEPVLLFPYADAIPLDVFRPTKQAVTLVVPDGNWRQAFKMKKRVPGLSGVRCVSLPTGAASEYRLRAEAHANGLATIEAIARALGILEGRAVQEALESVFRTMVERTLWSRGTLDERELSLRVPEGTKRHHPAGTGRLKTSQTS